MLQSGTITPNPFPTSQNEPQGHSSLQSAVPPGRSSRQRLSTTIQIAVRAPLSWRPDPRETNSDNTVNISQFIRLPCQVSTMATGQIEWRPSPVQGLRANQASKHAARCKVRQLPFRRGPQITTTNEKREVSPAYGCPVEAF